MSWRTIVISSQSKLDYKMGYMVVRNTETTRVFLEEVAILMIENPAVSFTGCLVEALVEKKIKVIFCDNKRNPIAELIPHHGSFDSSRKIRDQIKWTSETKALVWREIVVEKIQQQRDFLEEIHRCEEANLLTAYIQQVEPGDTTNREGHAAKVYFNGLFGKEFLRSADSPVNAALNYGYGIILSCVNREISANGYLTQLGFFHDNIFNAYNLGSDIMEPLRPFVDRVVYSINPTTFTNEHKCAILGLLNDTVWIDGTKQSLLNAIKIYVRSVFDATNENDVSLISFICKI